LNLSVDADQKVREYLRPRTAPLAVGSTTAAREGVRRAGRRLHLDVRDAEELISALGRE
jgi:hypothetical protein